MATCASDAPRPPYSTGQLMPIQRPECSVRCHSRSTSASSGVTATSTSGGACSASQPRTSSRNWSSCSDIGLQDSRLPRPSVDGDELELQTLQTPQQVDRGVLIAAGTGRAVRRLGDLDLGHAFEETFGADVGLGPGERRPRAQVDTEPEPDVLAPVRSVEAELGCGLELARIAIGR